MRQGGPENFSAPEFFVFWLGLAQGQALSFLEASQPTEAGEGEVPPLIPSSQACLSLGLSATSSLSVPPLAPGSLQASAQALSLGLCSGNPVSA